MRKSYVVALLASAMAFTVSAAPITPEEALMRAAADSGTPAALKSKINSKQAPRLVYTATASNGVQTAYVFDTADGFALLAADDAAQAVLGYGATPVPEGVTLPDNIRWWLDEYGRQIEYATVNPLSANAYVDPQLKAPASRNPIAPMVATRWNQDQPFNNDCPTVNGSKAVTGCVATAMAQVMKYHNWPAAGTGSVSYTDSHNNTYSMNFGTFDWDNMIDSYEYQGSTAMFTTTQGNAVAFLMKSCGYSVNMSYSSTESSAQSINVVPALRNYFNYDKGVWSADRNYYGYNDWEQMIYNNLATVGPVLYSGSDYSGQSGHAFVCDGYSTDGYFHINWGWGGMFDGYFKLTALEPEGLGIGGGAGGGFNFNQDAILGIQPPKSGTTAPVANMSQEGNLTAEADGTILYLSVQETQNAGFFNLTPESISASLGVMAEQADGTKRYLFSNQYNTINRYGGFSRYGLYLTNLPDGTYKVYPACKIEGEANGQVMLQQISTVNYVNVTKSGYSLSVSVPSLPNPTVVSVTDRSGFYIGHKFNVDVTISNPNANDFYGPIALGFVNPSNPSALIARSQVQNVDLLPNESTDLNYFSNFYTASGTTLSAGTYNMLVYNAQTGRVYKSLQITLNANPGAASLTCSSFKLDNSSNITPSDMKFHATVKCNSGLASDVLNINIYKQQTQTQYGYEAGFSSKQPLNLTAGQSETFNMNYDFSDASTGNYLALLTYGSSNTELARVAFAITTTGIEIINADSDADAAKAEYFDLTGRRVTAPEKGGLYIRRSGGKVDKIIF